MIKSRIQKLFDRVVTHTVKQGQQSIAPALKKAGLGSRCAYRGQDGLKCAIGCLIADEHYTKSLDRGDGFHGIYDPAVRRAVEKSLGFTLSDDEVEMLRRCQRVHDGDPCGRSWHARFREAARELGLTMPRAARSAP